MFVKSAVKYQPVKKLYTMYEFQSQTIFRSDRREAGGRGDPDPPPGSANDNYVLMK